MGTLNLGDILSQRETIAREMQVGHISFSFCCYLHKESLYVLSAIRDRRLFFYFHSNTTISLGVRSIEHPDVLSEKINFSAPGGPKSTIFDTDDVDPLYFEVSIVSVPTDPPYMSKNGKMCYFYHFLRVPKKTYTQSTGLP